MHHWGIVRTLAAGLAITLVAPATAAAQQSVLEGETSGPVSLRTTDRATGSLTIAWRGDPARGCSLAGLCDIAGSVTYTAAGETETQNSDPSFETALEGMSIDTLTPVARVLRGPSENPLGACVEPLPSGGLALTPERLPRRRARLTADPFTDAVSAPAGRCAGPLAADVAEALPTAEIAVADVLRTGDFDVDLSGRRAFAGRFFSGEVTSTLRFARTSRRVRNLGSQRSDGGSRGRRARSSPARTRRVVLIVEYRVVAVDGALTTEFAGGPEPFCVPLDACGLRGSHTVDRLAPAHGASVMVFAHGRARALRGGRGVAAALRATRAGRLRLEGISSFPGLRGRVATASGREGAPECREERRVELPALALTRFGGPFRLSLGEPRRFGGGGVVVTRCPGPRELGAAEEPLASGTFPASRLGARRLTVRLRPPPAAPGSYALSRRGEVVLALRRGRASVDLERAR